MGKRAGQLEEQILHLHQQLRDVALTSKLPDRDAHVQSLKEQLQEAANKATSEQKRAGRLEEQILDLHQQLRDVTCVVAAPDCNEIHCKAQRERDEAIRAGEHLEQALSDVLNSQVWYTTRIQNLKVDGTFTPERSPLPSTQ